MDKRNRNISITFGSLLVCYLLLLCFLPLKNAVQIGADEGYELAKATLSLKGYKMYSEVWNDQPPLHTFLITAILQHVSPSVVGPRLLSVGFAVILLLSFFQITYRLFGHWVGSIGTVLLISAPIFLELGASCMVEIPAMAPALAAIWLLVERCEAKNSSTSSKIRPIRTYWSEVMAGMLLAVSLQIKFINLALLPLMAFVLWLRYRGELKPVRGIMISVILIGLAAGLAFVGINELVDGQGFLMQFKQSWEAHFASAKSFEYGSPADHPFDWRILFRNWDASVAALFGVYFCVRRTRQHVSALIPLIWLGVNLVVFASHKPWWSCYYLHIAVPLCLCAAIGMVDMWGLVKARQKRVWNVLFGLYALCVVSWMAGRVCLEVASIRNCPQVQSCLFLEDIERYKPYTEFLYTDEPVYSFHAGIPMPPKLAVVALKRLWSGDMTNEKIAAEMRLIKPGIVLLKNDRGEWPFSDLLMAEYQPVYQDTEHRVYVHKDVITKARQKPSDHLNPSFSK